MPHAVPAASAASSRMALEPANHRDDMAAAVDGAGLPAGLDLPPQERLPERRYGHDQGPLELGKCEVSIPPRHQVGKLESPFVLRVPLLGIRIYQGRENLAKHVVLTEVTAKVETTFLDELRGKIANSKQRDALIFIHGYRFSFADACRRTAQFARDLKFTGAPLMFSWPSNDSKWAYPHDETDLEASTPDFKRFLGLVAEKSGASTVHLVAHSMGNRLLVNALASMPDAGRRSQVFNQVVLMAPDIDVRVFEGLAASVRSMGERTTMYSSPRDGALRLSRRFHGYPRLGQVILIVDGIETIDASPIDTSKFWYGEHSYWAKNRLVITDLIELLEGREASRRTQLRAVNGARGAYYAFRR